MMDHRRLWLSPKLDPIKPSHRDVSRTDLEEHIFSAGGVRLILLDAPAGFGKTTLMLQMRQRFQHSGIPTAWLTLDAADNDAGRFVAMLAAALSAVLPPMAPAGKDVPDGTDNATRDLAMRLLDQLAAHPAPLIIFLDDAEVLESPAVLGLIYELIEQLPRGVQVIVGSVPANFRIGRLRSQQRLIELGVPQLAFNVEETRAVLRQAGNHHLNDQDVRLLHRAADGWPLAIGLTANILRHCARPGSLIAEVSASTVPILDALVAALLVYLPDTRQRDVLRLSILPSMNAALCAAVCALDTTSASVLLEELSQTYGLVSPLEGSSGWYVFHRAIRVAMQSVFKHRAPDELPALHRRASDCFLAHGRAAPAIEHALASGDLEHALPLLSAHAEQLLRQTRMSLLVRWLDPLASCGALQNWPLLQAALAWAELFFHGPQQARPLIDAFIERYSSDPALAGHAWVMRPCLLTMSDQHEQALPLCTYEGPQLPLDSVFLRAMYAFTMATLATLSGRYSAAHRFFEAGRHMSNLKSGFDTMFEALEGASDLAQGRLKQATDRLRSVASFHQDRNRDVPGTTNGNAVANLLLAQAFYEIDHGDRSERLLSVYVPMGRGMVWPDQLIRSHTLLARVLANRGDIERANDVLTELEFVGRRGDLPRAIASARLERAHLMAMNGQIEEAARELQRPEDTGLWEHMACIDIRANDIETRSLALIRYGIRMGTASLASEQLDAEIASAVRQQHVRRALTLRMLRAEALWAEGRSTEAREPLGEVLRLATREGYVRPFVDEGASLIPLLEDVSDYPQRGATDDAVALTARALLAKLRDALPVHTARPVEPVPGHAISSTEALTLRERQVLQLLAEGMSNSAIGEHMFVATNTVRTHLRNINVKLEVRTRTEAVTVARRLGLIR
ncbi:LuxR C-terminal-related transcriptional regulator [Paraburkholderia sediminicola]|uniref:LuxR C-terminal-related transcriptional regulator n=1 Tax=Paraburkholderia sediminicola TaxID=458836 RepID=UPI0038BAB3A3